MRLRYRELTLERCLEPQILGTCFPEEVRKRSFSDGIAPVVTEVDYFYLIKAGEEIVGFYRTMDLFFDSAVELHGSYGYRDRSHLRSYFALARAFVSTIMDIFPTRKITTLVQKDNLATRHFVAWLGFLETGISDDSSARLTFELDKARFKTFNGQL